MGYAVQNMSLRNLNKVSFFVDKIASFRALSFSM